MVLLLAEKVPSLRWKESPAWVALISLVLPRPKMRGWPLTPEGSRKVKEMTVRPEVGMAVAAMMRAFTPLMRPNREDGPKAWRGGES